jgi:hypothetical protein
VDFAWLTGELQHLVDVFTLVEDPAAPMPAPVRKVAEKLVAEGVDLLKAVEEAEAIVRGRNKVEVRAERRRYEYERVVWDPFRAQREVLAAIGAPDLPPDEPGVPMATAAQVARLERIGIVGAASMSRRRASALIGHDSERRGLGLRTYKQAQLLLSFAVPPAEVAAMGFDEARARLDRLRGRA